MVASAARRLDVALTSADDRVPRASVGITSDRPVLAVVGTTAEIDPALAETIYPHLLAAVRSAARAGAVVVTGGTDSGVFHLLGLALAASAARPHAVVGVAPGALLTNGDGSQPDHAPIDPQLTALVRVTGDSWGDETLPLSRLVTEIAGSEPAVVLLVGGGDGTRAEVVEHLVRGRPLVVLAGSGRLADTLARDLPESRDGDLRALAAAGKVRVVETSRPPSELEKALDAVLAAAPVGRPRRRRPIVSVLPRVRLRVDPPAPLLGPDAVNHYPGLRSRIEEADRIVFPAFAALDVAARAEQNRYRWFTVLALVGGLLTTSFGALQAWLNSAPWPGVVVATLGAATSALTTVARRQGSLQNYLTARIRAERLRSLYFEHLARPPDDNAGAALEAVVAQHRYGPVAL